MQSRVRLTLALLTSLIALGSILSGAASAVPGPYWHQRKAGGAGNGVKISEFSPDKFQAKGGKWVLDAPNLSVSTSVTCGEHRSSGVIYNNALQGQIKIDTTFEKCETNLANCAVDEPIKFHADAHLMWKWRFSPKELEAEKQSKLGQYPELMFEGGEIHQGAKGLEKLELMHIEFKGSGTGECEQPFPPLIVKGYHGAAMSPLGVERWTTNYSLSFPEIQQTQSYWNGLEQLTIQSVVYADENEGATASIETQEVLGPVLTQGGAQQLVAIYEN
jgi:hypothetical protein